MQTRYISNTTAVVEQFRRLNEKDNCVFGWDSDELENIGDGRNYVSIAIFYPKGQRQKLPYPQNKKEK